MASKVDDRRRRYRINNMRAGKCRWCPNPINDTGRGVCLRHRVFYMLRKKGLTKGVLPPDKKRKRDALVAYIQGRETAIRSGYLIPGTKEQLIKEITEMRLRLNLMWGGVRGADKIAEIVRLIDLNALRQRNNDGQQQPQATA